MSAVQVDRDGSDRFIVDRRRLVCRVNDTRIRWGKATDWGRYIAGRAAALRGEE